MEVGDVPARTVTIGNVAAVRSRGMRILWRRWLINPRASVVSRHADVTRVRIDGLVCDAVCAARSRRALEALPGVRRASVDLDRGIATVEGAAHDDATYQRAIDGVVTMRPLRAALERIGRWFGYRERAAA